MKYLRDSFSSGGNSQEFRDGWDRTFGNKEEETLIEKDENCEDKKKELKTGFFSGFWNNLRKVNSDDKD